LGGGGDAPSAVVHLVGALLRVIEDVDLDRLAVEAAVARDAKLVVGPERELPHDPCVAGGGGGVDAVVLQGEAVGDREQRADEDAERHCAAGGKGLNRMARYIDDCVYGVVDGGAVEEVPTERRGDGRRQRPGFDRDRDGLRRGGYVTENSLGERRQRRDRDLRVDALDDFQARRARALR
jgi:hypothetical protein